MNRIILTVLRPSSNATPSPMPQNGTTASNTHLVFQVTLRDIDPPIWRLISVSNSYTLDQLHRVVQLVFGWFDDHLYEFRINDRSFWFPDDGFSPEEAEDSTKVTLQSLALEVGSLFEYIYDFGDEWWHDFLLAATAPVLGDESDVLPHLVAGERAGAPEDCGGPPGYYRLLSILDDENHPEFEEIMEWVGPAYDPELFDLWHANQNLVLVATWGEI